MNRTTRDLCQTCWQDANPGEYFPDGNRPGTCDECDDVAFVSRSRVGDPIPVQDQRAGCAQCHRVMSPVDAMMGAVCSKCCRDNHARVTGGR